MMYVWLRQLKDQYDLSLASYHRIIKEIKYFPHKVYLVHPLRIRTNNVV